jgi:hypothetical protein
MSRGYAEGPVAEEAERRLAELTEHPTREQAAYRSAVYGSTQDAPDRHFIGWLGDVDPDALFAAGRAWGITVVRQRVC